MELYNHDGHKFVDGGLQLRVPPDLVPPTQYARLTNGLPVIEGRIEGRSALNWIVNSPNVTSPGSGLHTISRVNQPSTSFTSDRIIGVDTKVLTLTLPAGNVAVSRDTGRTGDPLNFATFHFNNDSAAWQVIADRSGMFKYRSGSYVALGLQTPSTSAIGADSGILGNLNNGSGPGYDWVYTYVNTTTLSESNPSPTLFNSNPTFNPTSNTSPDPSFGGSAGTGVTNTTATLTAQSATETRQSVLFSGFAAGSPPFQSFLGMTVQVKFTASGGTTGGCAYGAVYFSLDGGNSWKLALDSNVSIDFSTAIGSFVIQFPLTQDLTKVQLRAVALSVGDTTVPQNVTARRIRGYGGNFSIAPLLTGGGGNAQMVVQISNITIFTVPVTAAVTTVALANRSANVTLNNPTDSQIDAVRLYRRGGSVTAGWAFAQQFPVTAHDGSSFVVNDNVGDSNLGAFVSLTNDAPITSVYVNSRANARSLPYIWGPGFNPARLFGCGDPDRPDAVYFSNPGNADQWGSPNWIDVSNPSDPMQNGCVFNTRVFTFSKEKMFELIPALTGGATLTPFETPCKRGLISPWALVTTTRAIYFIAKDGIYATDGGPEQSLVENDIKPLFPTYDGRNGRAVEGYDAVDLERIEDLRLRYHNDELYFIYRGQNTGTLAMLVYDQNKQRWRAASYPVSIVTIYSEEGTQSSLLLGDSTGSLYSTTANNADLLQASSPDISVTIRTGAFDQGMPLNQKEYGNVLVDIDPGGATVGKPITITPLLNGETLPQAAITVTGSGRQQVPLSLSDVFGYNISFDISFSKNASINPVLYQFDILWRQEPVSVKHWEARESSFGLPGFFHVRDAYVCLRSTATVTLTMTFDGTVQTYSIASTGGARRKVYVPFNANKGKVYKFALDSTSAFQLYAEDIELRCKPFITVMGYGIMKPFGAESTMATQALEAQVLGGK